MQNFFLKVSYEYNKTFEKPFLTDPLSFQD